VINKQTNKKMFLFLQSFRTAWVDSFPGTTPTTYSSGYGERQTPSASSDGGVYILNSLFNRCTSTSDGGALYCSTSGPELLIESTSFFSCKTSTQYGGAIYFSNTNNGQSVLYGVCCNDCCTSGNSYGQFAYIYVRDTVSNKNYVNYSSIARCLNEISSSRYILYLYNGKIYCPSVNISMNKCEYHSGISYFPFKDLSLLTSSLSYSSFTDNNSSKFHCIYSGKDTIYKMKCCNILRNTLVSTSWGVIYSTGNLTIEDSCILNNIASHTFETYSYNIITLSNCTVDKTAYIGKMTIQNTATKSFIHTLNHMSTQNCHAEYTFAISPSNKKQFYCSYKYNQCIVRISDFFTLNWVFLITLIHPNPYNYCLSSQ
jgi:hypothetical protein